MVISSPARVGVQRRVLRVDVLLVAATVVASIVGVVMVYSATRGLMAAQGLSPHYYLIRQALYVVLGLVVMVVVAAVDYRHFQAVGMALYGLAVLSLMGVFVVGSHVQGSQRWYSLGIIQLQPSEFAVLAVILAVATYCSRRTEGLTWSDVTKVLILAGIPIVLVMLQPDLGTAIIMVVVLLVMLAVAGLPGRTLVILAVGGAAVVAAALELGILHHYQLARLTVFLHPNGAAAKNPFTASTIYNLQQAKAALGSGGLTGTGIFHGAQTNLGYVPEQQTDFIFTAVGEQLGFIGSTALLAVLGAVAWRILRSSQLARDSFGRLLCAGAFAFVAFSVFQNAGMTMGIMPITGIPLPFVSYGGTAVLCFFIAVGVSLNVYWRRSG